MVKFEEVDTEVHALRRLEDLVVVDRDHSVPRVVPEEAPQCVEPFSKHSLLSKLSSSSDELRGCVGRHVLVGFESGRRTWPIHPEPFVFAAQFEAPNAANYCSLL